MLIYEQFVKFDRQMGDQLYGCCPFHAEKTPSFTVNKETGEWFCHGECNEGGAEKEFIAKYFDVPVDVAQYAVSYWNKKGVLPFPTEDQVEQWHNELRQRPTELKVLYKFGFTDEVIDKLQLGYSDTRITIPIRSQTNQLVNIRRYLPPHRRIKGGNNAKCLNIRGLGSNRYWPYEAFDQQEIYIVEGEKDCISARSQGLNAVTGTGGSAIPTQELALFRDHDVVIMVDQDKVGQKNTQTYMKLLRPLARTIRVVKFPEGVKDFAEYWEAYQNADVLQYAQTQEDIEQQAEQIEAQDVTLVRSEFTEHLNTWVKLHNMSVVGVEPKIYTVPTKIRAVCKNSKCAKPCQLAVASEELTTLDVDPRHMLQFVDAADSAQDTYLRKLFNCRSVQAVPLEYVNVQKVIFQESASFIDGLEESSFESRYGIYTYTDYRLSATLKYDFEACRVTDPRNQQNYYVIRSAQTAANSAPVLSEEMLKPFREVAAKCDTAQQLIEQHYNQWMPSLGIEGRPDLFGALALTYCSVTEIPWQAGLIKGWLDTMIIGDTRTGKSQMAQRFVKRLGVGGYINGENARATGVIGGVQRFGDSWVVTWGAIPMNDRGALTIDEASGLEIEDIKNLSSTRSSGAVTLNKIVKGEARARTRLIWLSNPRRGCNLEDFYWKGYGAFQEFIPVTEDQARYDLVLTAAREDIDHLEGIECESTPDIEGWRNLIAWAWSLPSDSIAIPKDFRHKVKDVANKLNDDFGGGPLVIGVSVHEKLLRLVCAFGVLCGDIYDGKLQVSEKHLQFADQFLRTTLTKPSFGYSDYIREFKRAQQRRSENIKFIRTLVAANPALKVLLSSSGFKGFQFQEILGMDRVESSKIMSDLITRGLLRPTSSATYVPDKMLMDIAKQMEV